MRLLLLPPTIEEVKKIVFSMNGDKAAGLDGFTSHFYTDCWDILGDDLFRAWNSLQVSLFLKPGLVL